MEVLTLHFANGSTRQVAVSDWYCKPAILGSLACRFGVLFITSDKYGCRQFCQRWSSSYPVHNIEFLDYKERLPWIVIEFNSNAKRYPCLHILESLESYYLNE